MKNKILALCVFLLTSTSIYAANAPFNCQQDVVNKHKQIIVGYLGADTNWQISAAEKKQLEGQLQHVDVINYSFVRFKKDANGNTVLDLTPSDIANIKVLQKIRPDLAIVLSIGGWGGRGTFKPFLEDAAKRDAFIKSVYATLHKYNLQGIDVDWENEQLSTPQDRSGLVDLIAGLRQQANGLCVTNAVPGSPAYWKHYPSANLWAHNVDWTTVMAYDHYGTYGPKTEYSAALFSKENDGSNAYPYAKTSGDDNIRHYVAQGLPVKKALLGVPFYCHSYYVKNSDISLNPHSPGLHVPVLDPNISSQISYKEASQDPKDIYTYKRYVGEQKYYSAIYYGLREVPGTEVSRFMSCDTPVSMIDKMHYVMGTNPLGEPLGGVSFWSLLQDQDYNGHAPLLRVIYGGLHRG